MECVNIDDIDRDKNENKKFDDVYLLADYKLMFRIGVNGRLLVEWYS